MAFLQLLDLEREQEASREALSALRQQSGSRSGRDTGTGFCASCGAENGPTQEPVWFAAAPSSTLVLLPHERALRQLEQGERTAVWHFFAPQSSSLQWVSTCP